MSPFQTFPITVRSDARVLLSISPETFHFVKDPRIPVARQCWRRLRIKFILKFSIHCCLKGGVECYEDVMGRLVSRGWL